MKMFQNVESKSTNHNVEEENSEIPEEDSS